VSRQYKPQAGFWIRLCVLVLVPLDGLFFRIRWHHLERMPDPACTGVIIVVNHISHIDTVLTARMIWDSGRIPRFLIKSSLFGIPVVGKIMKGARQIPVYRGSEDAAKSLRDAVTALNNREAVVIYAEGTITHDPSQWPMQAKTGVARLALLAPHIPIVPIGQWGAQKTSQRWRWFTRRRHEASVGEPLDLTRWSAAEPDADTLREITDHVMSAVREQVAALRGEPAPAEFFLRRPPT